MSEPSRKQREILQREQLIKDCALKQIQKEGFHALSMNKIAKEIEYSKGTVYQHFSCKEDIVGVLCIDCSSKILDLFRKAASFDGNSREKMLAIFYAYFLNWQINPDNLEVLQIARSPAVQEKLSDQIEQKIIKNEQALLAVVADIVTQAIHQGDLKLQEQLNPTELVFGLWAAVYGGMVLESMTTPWSKLGISSTSSAVLAILQASLDGLNWQPLSSTIDEEKVFNQIKNRLFAQEPE